MHRRWLANRTNAEYLAYLSKAASISPVFAQILINRGIRTVSDVHDFLHPGLTGLSDPFDLPGMKEAIDRIKSARQRGEKVLVHGDYDADGLTATAITVSALRTAGIDTAYFIPHRMRDGYGFNAAGVEAAQKTGAQLVITVDCGICSFETADCARELRIDVIITDHHEPVIKGQGAEGKGQSAENAAEDSPYFMVPNVVGEEWLSISPAYLILLLRPVFSYPTPSPNTCTPRRVGPPCRCCSPADTDPSSCRSSVRAGR